MARTRRLISRSKRLFSSQSAAVPFFPIARLTYEDLAFARESAVADHCGEWRRGLGLTFFIHGTDIAMVKDYLTVDKFPSAVPSFISIEIPAMNDNFLPFRWFGTMKGGDDMLALCLIAIDHKQAVADRMDGALAASRLRAGLGRSAHDHVANRWHG